MAEDNIVQEIKRKKHMSKRQILLLVQALNLL